MSKEPIELHNKIYYGDNLTKMKEIPDESVDLIYLDPPFFTQRRFESMFKSEGEGELEIATFEDIYEGGVETYILVMRERVIEMKRILKSTGSILFHCDKRASHRVKIMLDEVFGSNFISEIIWKSHSRADGTKTKGLTRSHETIFWYSKTGKYNSYINNIKIPKSQERLEKDYSKIDELGRRYMTQTMLLNTAMTKTATQAAFYELGGHDTRGATHGWRWQKSRTIQAVKEGIVVIPTNGNNPYEIKYASDDLGIKPTDVWDDIENVYGKKNTYPTQKPEKLLERIIKMITLEGDTVMDPFMGSGTTIAVAQKLNRNFIGIDLSPIGVKIAAERVGYPEHKISFGNLTLEEIKQMTPGQFQQRVCDEMLAVNTSKQKNKITGGDGGFDGFIGKDPRTEGFTHCPLQVKQTKKVGRGDIATFAGDMHKIGKRYGFFVGIRFSKDALDEIAIHNAKPSRDKLRIVAIDATFLGSSLQYDMIFDNSYRRHIRGTE